MTDNAPRSSGSGPKSGSAQPKIERKWRKWLKATLVGAGVLAVALLLKQCVGGTEKQPACNPPKACLIDQTPKCGVMTAQPFGKFFTPANQTKDASGNPVCGGYCGDREKDKDGKEGKYKKYAWMYSEFVDPKTQEVMGVSNGTCDLAFAFDNLCKPDGSKRPKLPPAKHYPAYELAGKGPDNADIYRMVDVAFSLSCKKDEPFYCEPLCQPRKPRPVVEERPVAPTTACKPKACTEAESEAVLGKYHKILDGKRGAWEEALGASGTLFVATRGKIKPTGQMTADSVMVSAKNIEAKDMKDESLTSGARTSKPPACGCLIEDHYKLYRGHY